MTRNLAIWKLIDDCLGRDVSVMLLYVLESKGSSPGRQGFFMAVTAEGDMRGSIGGGIMEHKFVEMAKDKLGTTLHDTGVTGLRKQYHDKSAAKDQSGMICSGEQTILLYEIKTEERFHIRRLMASLEQNRNGTLMLSPAGLQFSDTIPEKPIEFLFRSETDWRYKEKTGYINHLYIIGGGHCALALSRLMRSLDFYIHVFDDREQLVTMSENNAAHEKQVITGYAELTAMIPPGQNNYVVIMTFGYRTDDIALRTLMHKDFGYIGLLGSQHKVEKMMDAYRNEGVSITILQRIHTPIGLQIRSQTPEEIAVSIAAEIIREKNKIP